MLIPSPGKRWLLAAALPLSIGTFQSRAARAQSIPPLRQSLPPRAPSLPPPDRGRRVAAATSDAGPTAGEATTSSAATASPRPSEEARDNAPAAPESAEPPAGYLDGEYLTTDWGGSRSWLLEHGVDFQVQYTAEGFSRLRGGTGSNKPSAYLGSVVASLDLDTGALGAWSGGTLHAHVQHLHGEGITEAHVGSLQTISNLDAEPFTTLAEYWYRQELLDGRLALKVGKQEGNVDFAASDYAGNLLDASFGVFPTLVLSTYPDWGLGIAGFASPTDWLTFQAAVFDGAPDGRAPLGGTTALDPDSGQLIVGEVQLHSAPWTGGLGGTLRLGGWYHTAEAPALPEADGSTDEVMFDHNHGFYGIFDHKLFEPAGEGREDEGLGLFLQAGYAPQDRNEARLYLGGGLAYTGPIPGRAADVIAIGCGHVGLARSIRAAEGRTSETLLELTYRAQLTGFLTLQPDAQYVLRPSGDSSLPNAFVTGIRLVADL